MKYLPKYFIEINPLPLQYGMSVLFSGFIRNESEQFLGGLFVPHYLSFPMNPENKTLIPYIYNVSIKDPF